MENKQKWLIVALATTTLILIAVGFVIGYLSVDDGCSNNPLVYGIEKINEVNEDYFTCSCTSSKGFGSFYFDEEGMKQSIIDP